MTKLDEHPTVLAIRERRTSEPVTAPRPLDPSWLRKLCLDAGADDVGFVSLSRPELSNQRGDILGVFPPTKSLLSLIFRMNRESIRSTARSAANVEFHSSTGHANHVAHRIVAELERAGVRAMNPAAGFPMEMDRYPGKVWIVSHKPVAVAAGMGHMGIHRNVIHPKFGSFITLDTVLVAAEIAEEGKPADFNPCVECKLCVAACPVGAIKSDGYFDFSACSAHNYHEFMGGFTDWVATVADSRSGREYRKRVPASESASMWQSLSFGANYKAAYCMAVCPAGEDVISPFLDDRSGFVSEVVKPLQERPEPVFVVPGSDAERHVKKRFPNKTPRPTKGLRPTSIRGFLLGLTLTFQREAAKGVSAVVHFTFTGPQASTSTVVIRDQTLTVQEGHTGIPDLRIKADGATWLGFVTKERNLLWALLRRKIQVRGSLRLMLAFGKCFPS